MNRSGMAVSSAFFSMFITAAVWAAPPAPPPAEPTKLSTEVIVEKSLPAIVAIRADSKDGVNSGAGFLVDAGGLVVTNLHVIRGASTVAIKLLTGEVFDQVRIAGFDEARDLVVLKFGGFGLPTLPLGNSDKLKTGERVIAIGHPVGLENTVSDGLVSNIRLNDNGTKVIQISASVSPGNSGGPVMNDRGEVVGVVSFKISGKDTENLNFAIPINYARGLMSLDTPVTLAEMATTLAGKKDLFSGIVEDRVSGTWKSLISGTTKTLKQDGDYIYGDSRKSDGTPSSTTYELKKQPDGTYSGSVRSNWACYVTNGFTNQRVDKTCNLQGQIVFTTVRSGRIEGRITERPQPPTNTRAFAKFCESCQESVDPRWVDFVWVRMD